MISLDNYASEYEMVPIEILIFFSETKEGQNGQGIPKTVWEFCEYYKNKYENMKFLNLE